MDKSLRERLFEAAQLAERPWVENAVPRIYEIVAEAAHAAGVPLRAAQVIATEFIIVAFDLASPRAPYAADSEHRQYAVERALHAIVRESAVRTT